MPAFDVCMEAENHIEGASLMLKACNNPAIQKFDFNPKNQIKALGKYDLCVAVEQGNSRQDGAGMLPHLIRTLQLKSCSQTDFKYTAWKIE